MNNENHSLTTAEWYVMEVLWQHDHCTGREAVEQLSQSAGWSRSTTLTVLRRMTEKGLIVCEELGGVLTYSPLISKEEATLRETTNFLERVYHGSMSMMLSAFTRKQPLSPDEISELYAILDAAKEASEHD